MKFQASEANSWRRSASSNPGTRVCAFSLLFFSFLLLAFFFSFTFTFIKLLKPVGHQTNCSKKHVNERPKGDREKFAASLDLWITDLCLTRGVHLVSNMI